MQIEFIAGFGPIVTDSATGLAFYRDRLGLPLNEAAPDYFATESLHGANAFALWPLNQAARSTFGSEQWPANIPVPQAWLEFDVESPAAVAPAVAELEAAGYRILRGPHDEPWGQTTSRILSPDGLLIGITHTPWLHKGRASSAG